MRELRSARPLVAGVCEMDGATASRGLSILRDHQSRPLDGGKYNRKVILVCTSSRTRCSCRKGDVVIGLKASHFIVAILALQGGVGALTNSRLHLPIYETDVQLLFSSFLTSSFGGTGVGQLQ